MADIHDLQDAQSATSDALSRLNAARELAFDTARAQLDGDADPTTGPLLAPDTVAVLAGLEAIAFSIRELGVRLDYVTRDERVRARRS